MFVRILVAACVAVAIAGAKPRHLRNEQSRILHGEDAANGEFPFMVSMRYESNPDLVMCGGAIISENFVLTAGHCVEGEVPGIVFIVAGVTNLQEPGIWYATTKLILHEGFNSTDYLKNDVGLIKVNQSFVFNDVVQPISLPKESDVLAGGEDVTVMGWGYSAFAPNDTLPQQLQKVSLKTVDSQVCQLELKPFGDNIYSDLQLCAGGINGTGMCYGDSGSPLTQGNQVLGLVSWGIPCGKGYPDIFTRVSHYVPWIQKHLAEDLEQANVMRHGYESTSS